MPTLACRTLAQNFSTHPSVAIHLAAVGRVHGGSAEIPHVSFDGVVFNQTMGDRGAERADPMPRTQSEIRQAVAVDDVQPPEFIDVLIIDADNAVDVADGAAHYLYSGRVGLYIFKLLKIPPPAGDTSAIVAQHVAKLDKAGYVC